MRKTYEKQLHFAQTPIEKIQLDPKSRFEIVPVLAALQHIYSQKNICDEALQLIENDLLKNVSSRRGRKGMNTWQVFVLAVIRQACNYDYAALQDAANHHTLVREFLQINPFMNERFQESTLHENISQLQPETLEKIAYMIAEQGQQLVPEAAKKVRGDSTVVQTNIHYPTDSSLLWDGVRKILILAKRLALKTGQPGWRQSTHLHRKAKQLEHSIAKAARSRAKNREEQLEQTCRAFLLLAGQLIDRALQLHINSDPWREQPKIAKLREALLSFLIRTEHVANLTKRRIIDGEKIPNCEKIFSLFELHTELICRGKKATPTEFGHRILLIEDASKFVVHAEVMSIGSQDVEVLIPAMKAVQQRLKSKIEQASFDRGFWSPENDAYLQKAVGLACLPRKGRSQSKEKAVDFVSARCQHAAIESKIGSLQSGNGLVRCRDKGRVGFARYVMLAVVARNLQTLGRLLLSQPARIAA